MFVRKAQAFVSLKSTRDAVNEKTTWCMRQASESLQKHGSPLHLPFSVSFAAAVETRTAHNKLWLRKANVMLKRERILTQNFLIKTSRNFFTDDIDFVPEVRHIQSFNQINT